MYLFGDGLPLLAIGELAIVHPLLHNVPDHPEALELHSIELLRHQDMSYLLLGMRNGYLLSTRLEYKPGYSCSFTDTKATKVGLSQVELISAPQRLKENPYVFLSCDSLWEVSVKSGHLEINEVLFDNDRTVDYFTTLLTVA